MKANELHAITLKIKSQLDKEGFRNLSHARFFEELKDPIADAFECATKATTSTTSKFDEHDATQSFKLALSNNNQISIDHLPKNEDCCKILKTLCKKEGEIKLGEPMVVKEFEEAFV